MQRRLTSFAPSKAFLGSWILSVAPLLAAACSNTGTTEGPFPPSGTPVVTSLSQSGTCSLYVACMGVVDPAGQAVILAAYGPNGSCWETTATSEECDSACVSGLAIAREDKANLAVCGECVSDSDCPSSAPTCDAGVCAVAERAGIACAVDMCGSDCTNLKSDPDNCGTCGHACGSEAACSNGACTCDEPGFTACASGCSELASDPKNCGACGDACPLHGQCNAGVCSCAPGEQVCSGACTDLATDDGNCGACGNACPVDDYCMSGACTCAGVVCDGACTDTNSDPNNCGGCGGVCGSGVCQEGACLIP